MRKIIYKDRVYTVKSELDGIIKARDEWGKYIRFITKDNEVTIDGKRVILICSLHGYHCYEEVT
jgi:hypothetical protein